MAGLIGTIVGLVFGAALLGALLAWLLRRVVPMPIARSQAIGVAVATLVYVLFSSQLPNATGSIATGILVAVLGGLAAFAILRMTSRAKA